eukprot:SAG31_NODE_431_length_15775_cov_3.350663_2_plen_158_part_00
MLCMSIIGNELTKDFRPNDGGILSDGEGNQIGVRAVQQQVTLSSSLPTKYFHELESLLIDDGNGLSVNFKVLAAGRVPATWAETGFGYVMVVHTSPGQITVDGTKLHFDTGVATLLGSQGFDLAQVQHRGICSFLANLFVGLRLDDLIYSIFLLLFS